MAEWLKDRDGYMSTRPGPPGSRTLSPTARQRRLDGHALGNPDSLVASRLAARGMQHAAADSCPNACWRMGAGADASTQYQSIQQSHDKAERNRMV